MDWQARQIVGFGRPELSELLASIEANNARIAELSLVQKVVLKEYWEFLNIFEQLLDDRVLLEYKL